MRWKYEQDLNTFNFLNLIFNFFILHSFLFFNFFILHSCCSVNALQQTSYSPKYLTSRAGPFLGGLCRLSNCLWAKWGAEPSASNLNLITFLGFWSASLSTNQNFYFLMWFFKLWTKKNGKKAYMLFERFEKLMHFSGFVMFLLIASPLNIPGFQYHSALLNLGFGPLMCFSSWLRNILIRHRVPRN